MKSTKKDKKQTFMSGVMTLMTAQILVKLVGIVYKVYLTNRNGFGDEGNALYNAGYSIYELLLLISSIGIPNAISKLVSERVSVGDYKAAKRVFKISLFILGTIGSIATLILFFGANVIADVWCKMPEAAPTLRTLSPAIVLVCISSVIRGYFNGRSEMKPTGYSQTIEQILKTVFTVVVVEIAARITNNNVVAMAAGATAATTLSAVGSLAYIARYYLKRKNGFDLEIYGQNKETIAETRKELIKKILYIAIPVSLTSIVTAISHNIDLATVVRELMKTTTEVEARKMYGILSGKVSMLTALPLAFTIAFATALVPNISAAKARGDKKEIGKRIKSSFLLTTIIGFPCAFGLFTFAEPIMKLMFPNASDGASILRAASMVVIFTTGAQTLSGALQGLGNYRAPVVGLVLGAIVKTILNICIISNPNIGIYGACISTVISQAISFGIELLVIKKMTRLKFKFTKFFIKPFIASIVMSIAGYGAYWLISSVLKTTKIATVIGLIVAVITYFIAVVFMKILSKEEIKDMPKGEKIYNTLVKIGVYKVEK